jgi:catechol 2,3-dioxygenase-like lactoylglutathione lyase family enzyme
MRGPLGGHLHESGDEVSNLTTQPRVTSFAPQFLVDDLERSISYYRKVGFTFGEPWDGFYAIGELDGLELHLKEAPKSDAERKHRRTHEHLDAAAGVDGIEAFYAQCVANGVTILRPLAATAWGTKDFYIEDPDGYIIAFGGRRFESGAPPRKP